MSKDRDFLFHQRWLGLAQPIEGLVFSVPVLADAQIAPEIRPELSAAFEEHLDPNRDRIRDLAAFFRGFLGYGEPGMLAARNVAGESHDVWGVNVEEEYHEEVRAGDAAPGRFDGARAGDRQTPETAPALLVEDLLREAFARYDAVALGGVVQGTTSSRAWRMTPAAMRWAISLGCSSSTPSTTSSSQRRPRYAGSRSTTLAPASLPASATFAWTAVKG